MVEGVFDSALNRRRERSSRATPLPPRYAIADASRRRYLLKERRPKAAYAPFPAAAGKDEECDALHHSAGLRIFAVSRAIGRSGSGPP
jgi:hypothetical protein